jgi:hypothetical protein
MARLFSNSEYIDVVLVYGETCGSAPRLRRISVLLLHEGLDIFDPNDTIEVLKEPWKMLPQQFAITEVYWKQWKNNNGQLTLCVMISYFIRIFTD